MDDFDNKYALTGKFLVALPSLNESDCFGQSVVYVCSHGKSGAMGLIINKRMDKFSFSDLIFQLPIKNGDIIDEINLYTGGPLEQVRGMVLHSDDYMRNGTIVVNKGIAISSTTEII